MRPILLVAIVFLLSISFVSCGKKRQNNSAPQKQETPQKVDTLKKFAEENSVKDDVKYFNKQALLELNNTLFAHAKNIKVQMIGTETDRLLARFSFHTSDEN